MQGLADRRWTQESVGLVEIGPAILPFTFNLKQCLYYIAIAAWIEAQLV